MRSCATRVISPMLADMEQDADGSLTHYIQKDLPGKNKEANRRPAVLVVAHVLHDSDGRGGRITPITHTNTVLRPRAIAWG